MIVVEIDELFVLGAYPPAILGLFALGKDGEEIVEPGDAGFVCKGFCARRHRRDLAVTDRYEKGD